MIGAIDRKILSILQNNASLPVAIAGSFNTGVKNGNDAVSDGDNAGSFNTGVRWGPLGNHQLGVRPWAPKT